MKTPYDELLCVRATGHRHSCTGCVFFNDKRFACTDNNGSRPCHDEFEDFIFIEPTDAGKAAYAALILEHGRQE